MDSIELGDEFKEELEQYYISLEIYERKISKSSKKKSKHDSPEKPVASIKFLGRNIFEHVMLHLKKIRSAELENTLRFLNQKQSFSVLFYLEHFLRNKIELELVSRAIIFLLKQYEV